MPATSLSRRGFLSGVVGAGVALPIVTRASAATQAAPNQPLVVSSKTNRFVREEITTTAWNLMQRGGSAMDAAERATNVSERDPRDATVGYGGDPNEDGFLQLDAAVMNGADDNNIGAVAALENIKTPSSIARLVMDRTDHWMLVGRGALRFATMHGFKEEDLLTDEARQHWLDWKENLSNRDYYFPPRDVEHRYLESGDHSAFCEWKGISRAWSVRVGSRAVENAAWSYPDPDTGFGAVRDYVAFHAGKMDACYVGAQHVTPQPGHYYGGWITPDIVGPFKGAPGTETW